MYYPAAVEMTPVSTLYTEIMKYSPLSVFVKSRYLQYKSLERNASHRLRRVSSFIIRGRPLGYAIASAYKDSKTTAASTGADWTAVEMMNTYRTVDVDGADEGCRDVRKKPSYFIYFEVPDEWVLLNYLVSFCCSNLLVV